MSLFRPAAVLVTSVLLASVALTDPARAATGPTTVVVEGTLEVVVVDSFGADAHADHLYTVVTDDGSRVPVDLDRDAPANGRFRGELVVAGGLESALEDRDLLPRAGATIAEDTRAGRAAVAIADDLATPLRVAESTVSPVTAAAVTTPAAHRVYVAVLDNRGSVEESDSEVAALVNEMTGYWTTESNGAITSFAVQGAVEHFSSAVAGTTATSCGMGTPTAVWDEAAAQFPGVSFATASRNHLFVAMADECGDGGIAGIARVGVALSSGGPMSFSMGTITTQVGVHEIGHTFGLGHANLAQCLTASLCGTGEYFDLYSPMGLAISGGSFTPPALGSLFRDRLGVVASGELATVSLPAGDSGLEETFTLVPRAGASGLRGLLVTDPVSGARYSVDLRTHTGRDAGTFYGSAFNLGGGLPTYPVGVTVERDDAARTALMTRTSPAGVIGSFASGTSFVAGAGLTVAVGSGGTVTVRLGTPDIQSATPTISGDVTVDRTVSALTSGWASGATFTYDWRVDGVSTGSTGPTFVVPATSAGKALTVRVTGSKAGTTSVRR